MTSKLASVGKRASAGFIDLFLSAVFISILCTMFGGVVVAGSQGGNFSVRLTGIPFDVGCVLVIIISAYLEFKFGKTPGKYICKTRVVAEESGSSITLKQSLIRNSLRLIDGVFLYLVGFIIIVCDKNHQRLGDLVAKTIVIDET